MDFLGLSIGLELIELYHLIHPRYSAELGMLFSQQTQVVWHLFNLMLSFPSIRHPEVVLDENSLEE